MIEVYWTIKNLLKNLRKKKFYAVFRFFFDSKYREDILYVKSLTERGEMILAHGSVPLRSITPGHSLNYPSWTNYLINKVNTEGWKSLEPMKVIWDPEKVTWLVVDGNHRLEALKRTLPDSMSIPVYILMPRGMDEYQYMQKLITSLLSRQSRHSNFRAPVNKTWH